MAFATYVASESIIPLHVAGAQYTIEFRVQAADKATEILKREPRSLSGVKETLYFGRKVTWHIVLEPVTGSESALIEEFLDSTADGQIFQFDPYGGAQNHKQFMTCDREDAGVAKRRFVRTGDYLVDAYEFSFDVNQRA